MSKSFLIIILGMISCIACTPILVADFDAIPEGSIIDQIVDLPGIGRRPRLQALD